MFGGTILHLFLGRPVFSTYFGPTLGENTQHIAGFFILSAILQGFETPVIQIYCRVSGGHTAPCQHSRSNLSSLFQPRPQSQQTALPVALVLTKVLSKEGVGSRENWFSFPPTPAVTLLFLPFVKQMWDNSTCLLRFSFNLCWL